MRGRAPSATWPIKEYPKEFNSFNAAKQRCNGTNIRAQRWYKGVEFRFSSFEEFMDTIGPKPEPTHQLDRTDTAGHYEPGNVRWVPVEQQQANKRSVKLITYNNKSQTIPAWERELGFPPNRIRARLNRGWSIEDALSTAVDTNSLDSSKRRQALLTWRGRTQSVTSWARELGYKPASIFNRLNLGWTVEEALSTPTSLPPLSSLRTHPTITVK